MFGAPCKLEAHADAALRAAVEIDRIARERLPADLEIGIGLHSGEVVAGNIGGGGRLDFTVIGDPVNTAARIESATRTTGDRVLFSGETKRRLLGFESPIAERPAVRLKGKSSVLDLYAPGVQSRPQDERPSQPHDHEAGGEDHERERERPQGAVERLGEALGR